MKISYVIGKGIGYREIAYYMGVNGYFPPIRTNRPHATPNYVTCKSRFELIIKDRHIFPQKTGKPSSTSNIYSKYFCSNFIEFDVYDTCDRLIWISGEISRITNKISKQGIPKTNINKIYNESTLNFGCSPNKYTCDILLEYLVSSILQAYSSKHRAFY